MYEHVLCNKNNSARRTRAQIKHLVSSQVVSGVQYGAQMKDDVYVLVYMERPCKTHKTKENRCFNICYLLIESGLRAAAGTSLMNPGDAGAVKSFTLISLVSQSKSNRGGAPLTEQESLLYYSLISLSLSWR